MYLSRVSYLLLILCIIIRPGKLFDPVTLIQNSTREGGHSLLTIPCLFDLRRYLHSQRSFLLEVEKWC